MARPRRSAPTRVAILETGIDLLRERGYHGTGLQAVLSRAGVPKGSFYNYFPSKEDFAVAVVHHFAEDLYARLDRDLLAPARRDALAALRRFLRARIRDLEAGSFCGGCLIGNLGGELEQVEACRAALAEAAAGWRDRLALALELAQEQGRVRDDLPARELADFLLDAWEGALIRAKLERRTQPLRRCLAHVLDDHFRPS